MKIATEISAMLNDDEALQQGYDLFLQLASDNLSPENIALFNHSFQEHGIVLLNEADESWLEQVENIDGLASFVEIIIALIDENEQPTTRFASLLLCRHVADKQCHILWNQ